MDVFVDVFLRFGWFMPEWTSHRIPLADHWRSLQKAEIASHFDVDTNEMNRLAEFTKDPSTGRSVPTRCFLSHALNQLNFFFISSWMNNRILSFLWWILEKRYYCDADYCKKGVFYPEACLPDQFGNYPPCAVLLAEYPGALLFYFNKKSILKLEKNTIQSKINIPPLRKDYMRFLIKQIPSLKLLVKVVWLGPNADRLVREFVADSKRRRAGRSILFFAWRPSTITESDEFLSLSFPQCETMSTPDSGKSAWVFSWLIFWFLLTLAFD